DQFLQTWVPQILNSPAWSEGSLLIIAFDEAQSSDTTACCGEIPGLNTTNPGGSTPGPGGGSTGAQRGHLRPPAPGVRIAVDGSVVRRRRVQRAVAMSLCRGRRRPRHCG